VIHLLSALLLANVTFSAPQPVSVSHYGSEYVGLPMYSGRLYDPTEPVCASNDWPIGAVLVVAYQGNAAVCVVQDRMRDGGNLDMTPAGFARLAPLSRGRVDATAWEVNRW